jgi:hypothetical protein
VEWLVPAILLILGLWIALTYRRLASLREEAIASWQPLDVLLRERRELVMPLVQVVTAQAPGAKKTTQTLLQARQVTKGSSLSPESATASELRLVAAVERVLSLAKTHPALEADDNFRRVRAKFEELTGAITELAEDFNANALFYNRSALSVPSIFVQQCASKYLGQLFLMEYFLLQDDELEAMRAASMRRSP